MDGKQDDQLIDEETMESASVAPPKPGEEDGSAGPEDGSETKPAASVGD